MEEKVVIEGKKERKERKGRRNGKKEKRDEGKGVDTMQGREEGQEREGKSWEKG